MTQIALDNNDVWTQTSRALRQSLADNTWNMWFQGVTVKEIDDDKLTLAAPNPLSAERIRSAFVGLIADAVKTTTGLSLQIDVCVASHAEMVSSVSPEEPIQLPEAVTSKKTNDVIEISYQALDARNTFDTFVVGASNRLAHAAALSVAESPGKSFNPLFIYGESGLGKTHLLHAIGQFVGEMYPAKRILYVSAETFLNEFIDAIRNNSQPKFKRRYRDLDVLLIDDIQFIERSEQLQEEFFHTFNSLYAGASQIVLTSDRPPQSMQTLESRLRTRFLQGLHTDIQAPEYETRLAILQNKVDTEGLEGVPDDVLDFIATNVVDNVRTLEGALLRITAFSSVNRISLTVDIAKEVLTDLVADSAARKITPDLILAETANFFDWSIEELKGKSRRRPLVMSRQIGMYVFRELTDLSYPRIAEIFGGRDHTTVMHAVEKVKTQMTEDPNTFEQVNRLISQVRLGG